MKNQKCKYLTFLLGILFPFVLVAQTNTLPDTGSVGIGTLSPLAKLSVLSSGTIGLSGNYANSSIYITDGTKELGIDPNQIYAAQELTMTAATGYLGFITSGVERIRVHNNGKVGIGTTTPDYLLDVNGTLGVSGRLFFGDFNNQGVGTIQIKNEGPNDGIALWTETSNIITKRIWIDDATNTLQITAGPNLSQGISVDENGNVGIGTSNPGRELEVNGTIRSKEVIVEATNWPDYVFEEDYDLPTLSEIEAFIKTNKHLPEVPSAKEMEANGISLGEMNMLLLKKIEELTLHTIEQQKELEAERTANGKNMKELLLRIQKLEEKKNK